MIKGHTSGARYVKITEPWKSDPKDVTHLTVRLPDSGDIAVEIEDRGEMPATDVHGKEFAARTFYVRVIRDFYGQYDVRMPGDPMDGVKDALVSLGYEIVG